MDSDNTCPEGLFAKLAEEGRRRYPALKQQIMTDLYGLRGNPKTTEEKINLLEAIPGILASYFRNPVTHGTPSGSRVSPPKNKEEYLSSLEDRTVELIQAIRFFGLTDQLG